jgi:hypothetical protein
MVRQEVIITVQYRFAKDGWLEFNCATDKGWRLVKAMWDVRVWKFGGAKGVRRISKPKISTKKRHRCEDCKNVEARCLCTLPNGFHKYYGKRINGARHSYRVHPASSAPEMEN